MNSDALIYLQFLLAMFASTEPQCGKPSVCEVYDGLRRGGYWSFEDMLWLCHWIASHGLGLDLMLDEPYIFDEANPPCVFVSPALAEWRAKLEAMGIVVLPR